MKKPQIYPQSFIARKVERGQFEGFYSLGTIPKETADQIAALPKALEALEMAHNALLYIAQEAEARAGVPKPIIGGARHHAAQAKAALLAAGYTD